MLLPRFSRILFGLQSTPYQSQEHLQWLFILEFPTVKDALGQPILYPFIQAQNLRDARIFHAQKDQTHPYAKN